MAIAIGDIHGNLKALKELVEKLPEDKQLVFLGDYIDRGPDSAGVVDFLIDLSKKRDCIFLSGNHEDMMLNNQELWLMNGGYNALLSYGMHAIPSGLNFLGNHLEFFQNLKRYHIDNHAVYVHAGIDLIVAKTEKNFELSDSHELFWVREDFYENPNNWKGDKMIIFGHTPTFYLGKNETEIWISKSGKLVGIDTLCYKTGVLTGFDTETKEIYQS